MANQFRAIAIDNPHRLPGQIATKARTTKDGSFGDGFDNYYPMKNVSYSLGNSSIRGEIHGTRRQKGPMIDLSGSIDFTFEDMFRDPFELEDRILTYDNMIGDRIVKLIASGLEDASEIAAEISQTLGNPGPSLYNYVFAMAVSALNDSRNRSRALLSYIPVEVPFSSPYGITEIWEATFSARILADASTSRYAEAKDRQ
ncbi:hypothetical protein [Martelella alba]|uniref:hypothetical protein n=1 Tax=Martelella alba TaxID=2590451 RepID=UPI001F4401F1|nr:hypothetical protein [Martelella alba]